MKKRTELSLEIKKRRRRGNLRQGYNIEKEEGTTWWREANDRQTQAQIKNDVIRKVTP